MTDENKILKTLFAWKEKDGDWCLPGWVTQVVLCPLSPGIPCAIDGRGLQDLPSSEVIPQHCFPLVRLLQLISVDGKSLQS